MIVLVIVIMFSVTVLTGAGIATVIAFFLEAAAFLYLLLRGNLALRLPGNFLRFKRSLAAKILRIGSPSALDAGLIQVGFIWYMGMITGYGTQALAAYMIGVNIMSLSFMPGWGFSVAASALVGLAPALQAARTDLVRAMEGARVAGGRSRLRSALVAGQVALSMVLVSGALLFARSFDAARSLDLGWEPGNRLVVQVDLRAQGYSDEEGLAFLPRALDRLAALPGVGAVTTTRMVPFQGDWSTDVEPVGSAVPNTEDGKVWIGLNAVGPGYFDVMGIPIVRGRALGTEDRREGALSVVMNETLAATLFPGQDPLGQGVDLGGGRVVSVVGVARDATYYELGEEPTTQMYGSVFQIYQPQVGFVLRTAGDAAALAPAAQAALREIDPNLAFPYVTTLDAVFEDQTARYRVSAVLVGVFSVLALVLAAAGLYGVVSFLVAQRTREIGVRMALGARRSTVAGEVLRSGLAMAGAGLVVGLAGAWWLRRLTAALLFGAVRPDDPWALVGGCMILAGVVTLASLAPARRATRVDPMEAIRAD